MISMEYNDDGIFFIQPTPYELVIYEHESALFSALFSSVKEKEKKEEIKK